jgi:hypothetical protein
MTRHEVKGTRGSSSGDCLDIPRETIITAGGMETGHGQQVLEDMFGFLLWHNGTDSSKTHVQSTGNMVVCKKLFLLYNVHFLQLLSQFMNSPAIYPKIKNCDH